MCACINAFTGVSGFTNTDGISSSHTHVILDVSLGGGRQCAYLATPIFKTHTIVMYSRMSVIRTQWDQRVSR